ncbi:MAG: hypothetical protein KF784_04090 [Fimbriimonadaceae bacterium]|nr:hypothetical protein [Fimbriimonadaceae bacterium]
MRENDIFSESEVTKIVQRAVEMQEAGDSAGYSPGVTKDELLKVAKEIGVSPIYLEQAISEAQRKSETSEKRWRFGTDIDWVVKGEIDPQNFDIVASKLPKPGANPLPTQVGKTLSAKVSSVTSVTNISVSSRNGRTRIKVSSVPSLAAVYAFTTAFTTGVFGSIMVAQGQLAGVGVGILAAGAAACIGWLAGGLKANRREAHRIASDLESAVKDSVVVEPNVQTAASVQSRISEPVETTDVIHEKS